MKYTQVIALILFLPCLCGGEEILTPSKQLYDRVGLPLRSVLSQHNTYYQPVTLDKISPWLISAVVAAEDKRFYTHSGVDVAAILRAAWQNVQEGKIVSGASTITQQLARAITPRPKTFWGKTKEAFFATRLELKYTKEEILEQYFNLLEFGNLTQGVQAASQFYFNTDAADVSLSQAAFLAGLLKSPTYYNPLKHFSRALKRRDYVLGELKENGFINEEMYALALEEKITLFTQQRAFYAPHFAQFLSSYLPDGSTQIYTTLDRELQTQVEQIVKNNLARLTDSNVTNAAVVVLDNTSGGVLAYVGSADFTDKKHSGQVDGVRALRQPGSALKPFVYALALQQGKLTPATLLADEDTFFEGGFRPRNYDETFHGLVSVRNALACSYNIPAVKAAEQVGTTQLLTFLHRLGFTSLTRTADFYGLGISLGNGEVKLLELTNAYATLARGGLFRPVLLATRPVIELPGKVTRVLDEKTAYLVSDMLADNQARSEAFGLNSALVMPFEMAAKTGTSKDYKDNYALGYTPRWTVGVWVGNFDASPMRKVSGVTGAGPILHDLAVFLQAQVPSPAFSVPSGITSARVCTRSGKLAGPACAHTQEEVFITGHLPEKCDGKHQAVTLQTKIISPTQNDVYQVDPSVAKGLQKMVWQTTCDSEKCTWVLDGKKQKSTACRIWWPLVVGKHHLAVSCNGQQDSISFEVLP